VETNVVHKADWLLAIEGKVEPREVHAEREKLLRRFARRVKLPGFRPGKAPLSMVASRYEENVKAELAEEFASRAYREALKESQIRPLSQGRLTHWNFIADDELRFEVEAEVIPTIEVRGYRKLKLEPAPKPSEEELVEKHLERMQERMSRLEPVDREARDGDCVRCDYSVYKRDKKQDKQSGVIVKVGDRENFPQINAALSGRKAGEIAEAVVNYPDDAGESSGSQATYKFYIHEVKERKLPEMDDEFAKEMGFETMEVMRSELTEKAGQEVERIMKERREDQIFKRLLDLHPFDPPPALVAERLRYLLVRLRIPDTPQAREEVEPKAAENVRLDIILEAIAEKEEITVTDEELEAWFAERAERMGIPLTQAQALWRREVATNEARRRKTIDFLLEQAAEGGLIVYPDSH
jgi:trigger factor